MGISSKAKKSPAFGRGMNLRDHRGGESKHDWTFWFIIGVIAAFIVIVACVYFVRRHNALDKTYITVGEHEVTQVEFDFFYNTVVNSYVSQNSSSLLYMGLDTTQPLDEQEYIMDPNLTWEDYFVESTIPFIQQVKALNDEAESVGFEYDVTEDYDSYISSVESAASNQGVSLSYYYEHSFGKYATESRLEPFVKEYLTFQAYYQQLLEDNAPSDEEVEAVYNANPEQYDTIDYRLYSIPASVEDDATEEEITAAVDEVEERANEMADRFEAGEDWRELCYEYANDNVKESYDPEAETDPTVITGGTSLTISSDYFDWLSDDSRKADDVMVYRSDTNNACFIVVFDSKTAYDLEEDSADISGDLAAQAVSEYVDGLIQNYEVSDPDRHLNYLYIEETEAESNTSETGTESDTAETGAETDAAETAAESDTADTGAESSESQADSE